jgi:hypothetical protein
MPWSALPYTQDPIFGFTENGILLTLSFLLKLRCFGFSRTRTQ